MGELMDRFNAVAATNPYSWFPIRRGASELATPSVDNRCVMYPYTKYLCAIMEVDMAAAVLLTDAQTARDLGLDMSDVAFITGWADAHEVWHVSERAFLEDAPAATAAATAALGMAGIDLEDVTAFDLYSCFPSCPETMMRGLRLQVDDPRPLTLTGGLAYHGGPGSNYVTHVVANVLDHLRSDDGASVLVHANGGYLTHEAVGIYENGTPRVIRDPGLHLQARLDAESHRIPLADVDGRGVIAAYTVPFDRTGSHGTGIVVATVGARRTVAHADHELTGALLSNDAVGWHVLIRRAAHGNVASVTNGIATVPSR
jgi:acetyl-CoA C-acetyltransferase